MRKRPSAMNYPITRQMRVIIEQLHELRRSVDARFTLASAAAQKEWQRMRARIPALDQLMVGVSRVSEEDLAEMRSKVSRFHRLLLQLDPGAEADPRTDGRSAAS